MILLVCFHDCVNLYQESLICNIGKLRGKLSVIFPNTTNTVMLKSIPYTTDIFIISLNCIVLVSGGSCEADCRGEGPKDHPATGGSHV